MVGEVVFDGRRVDYHWWNRLGDGVEVDLTREQFAPDEVVTGCRVIQRPAEIRRLQDQYELRTGVQANLPPHRPAT